MYNEWVPNPSRTLYLIPLKCNSPRGCMALPGESSPLMSSIFFHSSVFLFLFSFWKAASVRPSHFSLPPLLHFRFLTQFAFFSHFGLSFSPFYGSIPFFFFLLFYFFVHFSFIHVLPLIFCLTLKFPMHVSGRSTLWNSRCMCRDVQPFEIPDACVGMSLPSSPDVLNIPMLRRQ
jgi:hypothetical protein